MLQRSTKGPETQFGVQKINARARCSSTMHFFQGSWLCFDGWMKLCSYPARANKFSSSGIEGDNVHPWVLLLGSQMLLSEDRTQMQHLGNGNCMGSCRSGACWRAGAGRENRMARCIGQKFLVFLQDFGQVVWE